MSYYEEGYKFIVCSEECQVASIDESDAEDCYECWPTRIIQEAQKFLDNKYIPIGYKEPYENILEVLRCEFENEMFWASESLLEWYRKQELEDKVRKIESTPHSVIILDYSLDTKNDIKVLGVYHSLEEAKEAFSIFARDARKTAEEKDWYIAEEFSDCFVAYLTGHYPSNHTRIFIQEVEKK